MLKSPELKSRVIDKRHHLSKNSKWDQINKKCKEKNNSLLREVL